MGQEVSKVEDGEPLEGRPPPGGAPGMLDRHRPPGMAPGSLPIPPRGPDGEHPGYWGGMPGTPGTPAQERRPKIMAGDTANLARSTPRMAPSPRLSRGTPTTPTLRTTRTRPGAHTPTLATPTPTSPGAPNPSVTGGWEAAPSESPGDTPGTPAPTGKVTIVAGSAGGDHSVSSTPDTAVMYTKEPGTSPDTSRQKLGQSHSAAAARACLNEPEPPPPPLLAPPPSAPPNTLVLKPPGVVEPGASRRRTESEPEAGQASRNPAAYIIPVESTTPSDANKPEPDHSPDDSPGVDEPLEAEDVSAHVEDIFVEAAMKTGSTLKSTTRDCQRLEDGKAATDTEVLGDSSSLAGDVMTRDVTEVHRMEAAPMGSGVDLPAPSLPVLDLEGERSDQENIDPPGDTKMACRGTPSPGLESPEHHTVPGDSNLGSDSPVPGSTDEDSAGGKQEPPERNEGEAGTPGGRDSEGTQEEETLCSTDRVVPEENTPGHKDTLKNSLGLGDVDASDNMEPTDDESGDGSLGEDHSKADILDEDSRVVTAELGLPHVEVTGTGAGDVVPEDSGLPGDEAIIPADITQPPRDGTSSQGGSPPPGDSDMDGGRMDHSDMVMYPFLTLPQPPNLSHCMECLHQFASGHVCCVDILFQQFEIDLLNWF